MKSNTLVFIHGMYMSPLCWEGWVERFTRKFYYCLAPAGPGRDQPVETLRAKDRDKTLGALTLSAVVDHLAAHIQKLDSLPVLIGHSMGGLITQILLQRGLAAAAIALDPAPPQGVFSTRWSFIKSNFPHINPLALQGRPIRMTLERFQYAFVNGLPLAEQRAAYDRYVVPESRRVPADSLTATARIDFKKPGAPLLMIAGGTDNIIPASLVRANYERYDRLDSRTDFKLFPGRTHFIIGQTGWEEVADYVAGWMDKRA